MKKILMLMIVVLSLSFVSELQAQKKETKTVCFKSSMDCANCEKTLTNHLTFEKGVKNLKVDLATNTILVEYKEGKSTDEKLAKAIEKKGYVANKITLKEYETLTKQVSSDKKK